MSDPAKYRTKEEVEAYKLQDPIERVKKTILSKKWATEADIENIELKIENIVAESVEFAENSPYPTEDALYSDIYQEAYPFIIE
jgi:pyruvate dehydrogenase E1 component alpha subunit